MTTDKSLDPRTVTAPPATSRWAVTAPDAARIATFAALICVLALVPQISVGASVAPITLQTLGVMLAGAMLGAWRGALAVVTYLLLALAGLPVLAGGTGGPSAFVGPSAGYLYGFVLGAAVTGWLVDRIHGRVTFWKVAGATVVGGVLVVYAVGIPVLAAVTGTSLGSALWASWVFLPGDAVKVVLTALVTVSVVRAYPPAAPAARRRDGRR
jgi:biotin transport system substrate-specific component